LTNMLFARARACVERGRIASLVHCWILPACESRCRGRGRAKSGRRG